jgi:hypothetical protein
MRRYWAIGILLVLAVVVGLRLAIAPASEPLYAGKTVSQWLDAGYEDAAMALQQIGPAAGPIVLARLARVDSRYGSSQRYRKLWTKLPPSLHAIVPKPEPGNLDELRASSILLELGPPITPLLTSRLNDHNPAVRVACARVLGHLRRQGSYVGRAFPALIKACQDPNPDVAALAAWALGDQITSTAPRQQVIRLDE